MTLAIWLALLPLRLLAALGLRRSLILTCLFVLAVTAVGVAQDLGLLDPPAAAKPARPARQASPSRAARIDIPAGYLTLYRRAAGRCPGLSWSVLAGIGKVESDHGRSRLPGVRSGWNRAGAAGPMQFGIGVGRAGNAWARYGHDFDHDGRTSVYDPGDAIPAAARYLCAAGAPHRLDQALYAYNHSWAYVAEVKQLAHRYVTRAGGRQVTAARTAPRPCPLCGNPTPTRALVEAHVGPTRQHPKADVVLWLCPPCAIEVTDPDGHQPPEKVRQR